MRRSFLLLSVFFAGPLLASTPTGRRFGSWQVTSINSLSGVSDDDSSAGLRQEQGCSPEGYNCSTLEIQWRKGSSVIVPIDIDSCTEEDNFGSYYSVPVERWLKNGRRNDVLVEASFRIWLNQARAQCLDPKNADAFDLKRLRPAVQDLTQRIGWFAR